jgi:hypothetical protein
MLKHFIRKPKYPIICNISGHVIGAKSERSFSKQIVETNVELGKSYDVVDSSGEGWAFLPEHMVISPLTFKKKWFKKEIVELFNNRSNKSYNEKYSTKSLPNKRFDRILAEIVELLKP